MLRPFGKGIAKKSLEGFRSLGNVQLLLGIILQKSCRIRNLERILLETFFGGLWRSL